MKIIATMMFALTFPLSAFANCPNIAAQYTCVTGGFGMQVLVTQTIRGGTTIYQVDNGGEIFADGLRHQTPTLHPVLDKHARNYSYKASCGTGSVSFTGVADLVRGGQGNVTGKLTKQGTALNIRLRLVTPDDETNLNLNCTR